MTYLISHATRSLSSSSRVRQAVSTAGVLLASAVCSFDVALAVDAAAKPEKTTYQDNVRTIFREHCLACHSQDDASSGLALDSYQATLAGGAGGDAVAAGDADGSRLWRLVSHQEEPVMPPGDKLPADQLAVIKRWIEGGLLDTSSSKPKKAKRSAVSQMKVSADNRPTGEPAMPKEWLRQPVVSVGEGAASRVGPITSLAASPWAPLVAVPWQRQVSLYHAEDLRLLGVLPYLDGVPRVTRFSRDGSLLLVAGGEAASKGSAALFDVVTGERLVTVGDELDEVLAADVSPDHALVAIGGPKKKVRVYRAADGTLAYELGKHTDWVTALRFSSDGKLLATADRGAGLLLWQARAGNPRGDLRGHKGAVTAVDWRGDSAVLASVSEDGEARLWRTDGRAIKNFRAHRGGATDVAFTRDGRIATTGRDRNVTLWTTDGKAVKKLPPMGDMALAVAMTVEDRRMVTADYTGAVRVVDAASGEVVGELAPNPPTLAKRLTKVREQRQAFEPQLAAAKAAVQAALQAEKALLEQADKLDAAVAVAESELQHFASAPQRLADQVKLLEDEASKVAEQNAKAASAKASAEKSAEQQQAAVQAIADKLAALRQQMTAQQQRQVAAEQELAKQLKKVEAAAKQLSEAQQAAERAAARHEAHLAAEKAREAYLKSGQ